MRSYLGGNDMDFVRNVLLVLSISIFGASAALATDTSNGNPAWQSGPAHSSTSGSRPHAIVPSAQTNAVVASGTTPASYYGPPYHWHDIYYGDGGPFASISATVQAYFAWYQHYWGVYSGCAISVSGGGSSSVPGSVARMYESATRSSSGTECVVYTAYNHDPGKKTS